MINFYQLTTFVTVISEGSMTAAADKLYLTQPAVSQQIRSLEEEMGVELLVRGVRQVKATPQGELLYEQAKRILQLVQNTEASVKSMGAELKGSIKIGTTNSVGLQLMSPIVGRLLRRSADLKVRVDYGKGEELVRQFKKNQLDVVILPEVEKEFQLDLEGTEKKFLLKEEMWLVASSKEVGLPPQIKLEDIHDYPFINYVEEYPNFNDLLQNKLSSHKIEVGILFESSNVGTLKRVIESGLGIGFLPAHSVKKQVRSGRMNRIYVSDFEYEVDLFYYFRKNDENKHLVDAFYQALSQQDKG